MLILCLTSTRLYAWTFTSSICAGCLPLLLQLLHGSDKDSGLLGKTRGSKSARARAAAALHNIVHCNHDDKRGRSVAHVLESCVFILMGFSSFLFLIISFSNIVFK